MKKKFTILLLTLSLLIALGICCFFSFYKHMKVKRQQEDIVWLARCELETLRNDVTVGYLRLNDMKYEDGYLNLNYHSSLSPDSIFGTSKLDILEKDFMSVIVLEPEKWAKVAQYLKDSQTDLRVNYSSLIKSPLILSGEKLDFMIHDKKKFDDGMELFYSRKLQEILIYARNHFKRDKFIEVDTIQLDKKYLTLHLLYDDSRARLGHTFLDTSYVSPHFTDKVGDMGTILDGMLSICVRTQTGFSFVYKGKKNRKMHRCSYSFTKAKELYDETVGKQWLDKRETNRIRTGIF